MAKYLKIRNWDRWQSYRKDRGQPPWIKVHRCLMRDEEWVQLTDAQRGQLVAIWLLAADRDGVIPASARQIQKLCFMTRPPDLQVFMRLRFIEGDANVTSERRQDDANVTHQNRIEENRGEEKESARAREDSRQDRKPYGDFVRLTEAEHAQLLKRLGAERTVEYINSLDDYIGSKGVRYKSHYRTILVWVRRDAKQAEAKLKPGDAAPSEKLCVCGCGQQASREVSGKGFATAECRKKVLKW